MENLEAYPPDVTEKLMRLASVPSMEILKVCHDSFKPPRGGGWPTVIFRALKLTRAALFAVRIECFCNDLGESGSNGKTWWQQITAELLGNYYFELKEAQLTAEPPGPEAPCATFLSMRGARGMGVAEVESELRIKGSWCKKIADSSTKWKVH